MKFDIKLFEDPDLAEFCRLLYMNEGSYQSDYDIIIDSIILKVQIDYTWRTKSPIVMIAMAYPPDCGDGMFLPRLNDMFCDIDLIKNVWDEWCLWAQLPFADPCKIADSIKEIALTIKRVNKLKAFA